MDYRALAQGVMRALRGNRSQTAFSRRLGYQSNVAYPWEAGRRFPTAAEMFRAAGRVNIDVRDALAGFFQRRLPVELSSLDPASPAFAATLLREIKGPMPVRRLATRSGSSASTVSRILAGQVKPRLPAYFQLIDAASKRLLDFLAGFVDLEAVPAAREEWARVQAIRRLSTEDALLEAVPRALELDTYDQHEPGWIAERLGVSLDDENRVLRDLATVGAIRWDGNRWEVDRERSIDTTRFEPRAALRLKAHWADTAATRIRNDAGKFSYLVFTTDEDTLAALAELQVRHFRELRALVASSRRQTRLAVANLHLFSIDTHT